MVFPPLPPKAEEKLREELKSEEKVLWIAQPLLSRAVRRSLSICLGGLAWIVFSSLFLVVWGLRSGGLHPLFWLLVLVGLIPVFDPLQARRYALKTVYALTDQRALVLFSPWWTWGKYLVRSIAPEDLRERKRIEDKDGSGTLIFSRLTTVSRSSTDIDGVASVSTHFTTVGFENIAQVGEVDGLIAQTYGA